MTQDEKIRFVETAIQKLFPNVALKSLTLQTNLLELGIDSLGIVELQMYYEEISNTILPDSHNPVITVEDLIKLIP